MVNRSSTPVGQRTYHTRRLDLYLYVDALRLWKSRLRFPLDRARLLRVTPNEDSGTPCHENRAFHTAVEAQIAMWDKLKGAWTKFSAENGSIMAAALSFYGFMTVLPALLLAVAVLGYVVGSSQSAFDTVSSLFGRITPGTNPMITSILRGLVKTRGGITAVGIVTLVWSSSQIFTTMQQAFNDVWEVGKQPGFIYTVVKAIVLLIGIGILFLLSVGSTSIVSYSLSPSVMSSAAAVLTAIGSIIVALIFDIALFTLLYRFVPNARVSWRSALIAGLLAGLVWEGAKQIFRVYLAHFGNYNSLYGSLGGIIILILWIYYSSVILLYFAELAYVDEYGVVDKHEEAERMQKSP